MKLQECKNEKVSKTTRSDEIKTEAIPKFS